jgi:hypothetical protein
MRIVQPIDLVDKLVGFGTEADRRDVQVFKAFIKRVDDKLLRLDSHELRVQPGAEQLSVEGLVPVVILVGQLERNRRGVGLDLSDVEEHLVDLLVGVGVGTAQIV